jgi:putative NADH-flavin reductase
VAAGVISTDEAELIGATRIEGVSVADYAKRIGSQYWAVVKERSRVEQYLVAAVRCGDLSDQDAEAIAEATLTVAPDPGHYA